ncbi:hypothetical protein [Flavobacterium cerinum]|uniref:Uncharacterized protein n=1 Tax=Flavobacterium cerinum TaxID=2502784 RepID=A0ABY5ISW5_9FLAO|nr:hypothetical protein [Flavobacterium cerinum]UUC44556.1 hypothetical protein NOX80_13050 [Flavobacterium cerinum]
MRIPKPCYENWNSMSPDAKGKFCNSCNKTVIDFTKMKDQEIQKYFIENSETKDICGRFKQNQIKTDNKPGYNTIKNCFDRIRIKPIQKIALFSLSTLLLFTSCIMGKVADPEEPVVFDNETINDGEISKQDESVIKESDSIKRQAISEEKNSNNPK